MKNLEQAYSFKDIIDFLKLNGPEGINLVKCLVGISTQEIEACFRIGNLASLQSSQKKIKVFAALANLVIAMSDGDRLAVYSWWKNPQYSAYGKSPEELILEGKRHELIATIFLQAASYFDSPFYPEEFFGSAML